MYAIRSYYDLTPGEFEDVLRDRVILIEEIPGARERIQEGIGDPPGMAAFAEDDPLDAEIERRLADASYNFV